MKGKNIKILPVLCSFLVSAYCFASNEGVPAYYQTQQKTTANRAAYSKYKSAGYTKYVTDSKQVVDTKTYSYKVPRQQTQNMYNGMMTANGIASPTERNTTFYAGYSRRFSDFEFKTGVNSILEWDDMVFNEINVGLKHVFSINDFDMAVKGDYTYGSLSHGGLSMDYDLEPYDYGYPEDGIFTISMGDQSGKTHHIKLGIGAHHVWDINGWKLTPYIGYEIFKHNLEMSNHIYPNPGVYLPLMTADGQYVYGATDNTYWAVPIDYKIDEDSGLYQVCMGPEDIKVVSNVINGGEYISPDGLSYGISYIGDVLNTMDWNSSFGDLPWGVVEGDCVVIGGDGVIRVDGTTHIYNTTWSGFYLGLEIEKQMTLADKLRFYVQVGMPKYSSEGTWPNRDDWQQNPSFLDEGTTGALSYEAELEYNYQLSDRMQLALKVDTNYFNIGKIGGELYVAPYEEYVLENPDDPNSDWIIVNHPAETLKVSDQLKHATWQSFGLHLGLKYSF
ncbi:MAG: hypothetical protein MJ158_00545 [Alphaproteobacteria bacterium]|nr:hypothetical protein [Alphaproteobacteria bacterium]